MSSTARRSGFSPRTAAARRLRWQRLAALTAVTACVLAAAPPASSTSEVGAARDDLRSARQQLRVLDLQLSLAAERLHEGGALLATLRGDLDAARTRSVRARAAAADAADAFDAMVRWAYESGPTTQLGVLGLDSVSELEEGVGLLSAMATHQEQVAAAAADARAAAAANDERTRSLEAAVSDAVAGQQAASRELNAAATRQRALIGELEQRLHHRIQMAVADRRAAREAQQAAPSSGPGPTGPSGPPRSPLPGPGEPAPTAGGIVDLITSLWGTGYDGQVARCVAWRESRYQPTARNSSSGAAGLFQLMPFWWDGNNEFGWKFDPYDPRENAVHAHLIWKADGWQPWTTGHLCV